MPPSTPSETCPLCRAAGTRRVLSAPDWSIRACSACSNAWTLPAPSPIDYEAKDFHQETKAAGAAAAPEGIAALPWEWQASIRQQVALLARHLPPRSRILEIGCGSGILLSQFRDRGYEVVGLEPSRSACERARHNGLRIYEGYFPNKALSTGEAPFDAVVMTHVLEHIRDPIATLEQVVAVAPGGSLLLVQTHWPGLVPRIKRERWYAWLPEEHFWHFTPQGFSHICAPLGIAPIETEFSSLVHSKRSERILAWFGRFNPSWHDQFHQLLQLPGRPADVAVPVTT